MINAITAILTLIKARKLARTGRKAAAYALFLKSYGYHSEPPQTLIIASNGDTLVLTLPENECYSDHTINKIKNQFKQKTPNQNLILLDHGMTLGIVKQTPNTINNAG